MLQSPRTYLPAAGRDWSLPLYDPIVTLLGGNAARRVLLEQAALRQAHRVLDIGCGTGTLAALIKRLQEERFMPLRLIRELMAEDPERAARLIEIEDRILERAIAAREGARTSRAQVREAYEVPQNVLERLEQLGILSPNARGYDADDVEIIESISRFRAGGYEEAIGFTVYDTLRYRQALEPLVEEEVRVLLERLAGEVEVDRAVEIIASGAEPLRDLIGALHSKLLLAALRRQRGLGV